MWGALFSDLDILKTFLIKFKVNLLGFTRLIQYDMTISKIVCFKYKWKIVHATFIVFFWNK